MTLWWLLLSALGVAWALLRERRVSAPYRAELARTWTRLAELLVWREREVESLLRHEGTAALPSELRQRLRTALTAAQSARVSGDPLRWNTAESALRVALADAASHPHPSRDAIHATLRDVHTAIGDRARFYNDAVARWQAFYRRAPRAWFRGRRNAPHPLSPPAP